jgi:type II secretory ATPase GspE/PulE/Tfp pilus assembly ATPase PilB-like protein
MAIHGIKQVFVDRATNIHFKSQKNVMQIRYCIDGAIDQIKIYPNLIYYQYALISSLKTRMGIYLLN